MTTASATYTSEDLERYRHLAQVSQADMAEAMRIPLRTYENLAAGLVSVRGIHLRAAQYALLKFADQKKEPGLIDDEGQLLVLRLAILLLKRFAETDGEFMRRMQTTSVADGLPTKNDEQRFREIEARETSRELYALLDKKPA